MNTVLFVNVIIVFSENFFLVEHVGGTGLIYILGIFSRLVHINTRLY